MRKREVAVLSAGLALCVVCAAAEDTHRLELVFQSPVFKGSIERYFDPEAKEVWVYHSHDGGEAITRYGSRGQVLYAGSLREILDRGRPEAVLYPEFGKEEKPGDHLVRSRHYLRGFSRTLRTFVRCVPLKDGTYPLELYSWSEEAGDYVRRWSNATVLEPFDRGYANPMRFMVSDLGWLAVQSERKNLGCDCTCDPTDRLVVVNSSGQQTVELTEGDQYFYDCRPWRGHSKLTDAPAVSSIIEDAKMSEDGTCIMAVGRGPARLTDRVLLVLDQSGVIWSHKVPCEEMSVQAKDCSQPRGFPARLDSNARNFKTIPFADRWYRRGPAKLATRLPRLWKYAFSRDETEVVRVPVDGYTIHGDGSTELVHLDLQTGKERRIARFESERLWSLAWLQARGQLQVFTYETVMASDGEWTDRPNAGEVVRVLGMDGRVLLKTRLSPSLGAGRLSSDGTLLLGWMGLPQLFRVFELVPLVASR